MRQTTMIKPLEVQKRWYVIDAEGQVVGRLAAQIALILRGKNEANFTPYVDCGDNVILINAEKIVFTGNKLKGKKYYRHSLYPGGLKSRTAKEMLDKFPTRVVEHAVKGMLPKTILGRKQFKSLFVYQGANHPHVAQKPEVIKLTYDASINKEGK